MLCNTRYIYIYIYNIITINNSFPGRASSSRRARMCFASTTVTTPSSTIMLHCSILYYIMKYIIDL